MGDRQRRHRHRLVPAAVVLALATPALAGCLFTTGIGGNDGSPQALQASYAPGLVTVYLRDASTPGFQAVWFKVTNVQVHLAPSTAAGPGTGPYGPYGAPAGPYGPYGAYGGNGPYGGSSSGPYGGTGRGAYGVGGNATGAATWVTVWTGSRSVDLLNFSAPGARAFLGATEIPSGHVTEVRLTIASAWGVAPDGTRENLLLTAPTARLVRSFDVEAGGTTRLVIDVNLNQSLHASHGGWHLTPVLGSVLVDHPAVDDQADHASAS